MQKLITIAGPTGVGKTKLSIILAKRFNGEVINGDAFQFYKGLDIGTAKVTTEEAQGIPHHLIDFLEPDEPYSVAEYQKAARKAIAEVASRDKLPILIGGTGLYIKAAAYDYRFTEAGQDQALRDELQRTADEKGPQYLHQLLSSEDPESANRIHANNLPRVIRALEVTRRTGTPFSQQSRQEELKPLYDLVNIGLTMNREELYTRINDRVDEMVENGLIDEAEGLYKKGLQGAQSTQAIGYKELFLFFEGTLSKEEAIQRIKQHSRQFAKRQLTWLRHQMPVNWYEISVRENTFSKKAEEIIRNIAGMFDIKSK